MDHAQPSTLEVVDRPTGDSFVNNNIYQKRSRAIDMWFFCVRNRVRRGQFLLHLMDEEQNLVDYLTKH